MNNKTASLDDVFVMRWKMCLPVCKLLATGREPTTVI